MAEAKLIAKLLLEDKEFISKLNKAKNEVGRFSKGGKSTFGDIGAAVGKFAAAIGAAQLATEGFNRLMSSSQTLADAWGGAVYAAESAVNSFFHTLGSGDFSAFIGGLDAMIARAREAYAAMDDLGNVQMSYNYASSRDMAKFQDLMNTARDESLSSDERNAALAEAKTVAANLQSYAAQFKATTEDAYLKELASKVGVSSSIFSSGMLDKALSLDINADRGELRSRLAAQKKAYDAEIAGLTYNNAPELYKRGTKHSMFGKQEYIAPTEAYYNRVAAVQKKYAEALAQWAALEIYTDEQLQAAGQALSTADNAVRAAAALEGRLLRVENSLRKSGVVVAAAGEPAAAVTSAVGLPSMPATLATTPDTLSGELEIPDYFKDFVMPEIEAINARAAAVDSLAGSFAGLGGAIGGTTGETIAWLATMMQQTSSIVAQIAVLHAEAKARKDVANAAMEEAASKTMAAYSGIPFAGVGLAVGALATIFALAASVPKFANGGVVTGPTIGLVGEAGAEAIIPLDRLNAMMAQGPRDVRVVGTLRARGKDLVGTIGNYENSKNVG